MATGQSEKSDEEIVETVRTSDRDLYQELITRYQPRLSRYVLSIVHDQDKTDDIVQETFIKAYVNLNSFNTKRKFSSWIYRIAHNEAVNFIRKHRREFHPEDETWFDRIPDESVPTSVKIDQQLFKERFGESLDKLPEKYRQVLVLHYFEYLSYQEISDVLRLPTSTVGVRINRAKHKLRDILNQEGIDYEW